MERKVMIGERVFD